MTTRETPLPDLAALVPLQAALLLHEQPAEVQGTVMFALREAIVHWEEAGLNLDPVSLEIVIDSFVRNDITRVTWALEAIATEKRKAAHR